MLTALAELVSRKDVIQFIQTAATFPHSQADGSALATVLGTYFAFRFTTTLRKFRVVPRIKAEGITYLMHWRYNFALVLFLGLAAFDVFLKVIRYLAPWQCIYAAYQPVELVFSLIVLTLVCWNFKDLIARARKRVFQTTLWSRLKKNYEIIHDRGITAIELVSIPVAVVLPWHVILLSLANALRG
jgi:hypothetical protein